MQDYLTDENLTNRHKQFAFQIRTNMGKFVRNIGNKGPCLTCKLPGTEDSQTHHLNCEKIQELCPEINLAGVDYNDIYSDNVMDIKRIVEVLDKTTRTREKYLKVESI